MAAAARRLQVHERRAILGRARTLVQLSRAPAEHVARHRRHLHQLLRELRASARRAGEDGGALARVHLLVLSRKAAVASLDGGRASRALAGRHDALRRGADAATVRRRLDLGRLALALGAHDPARTLERGYALVEDRSGEPLSSASAARESGTLGIRFHDGRVTANVSAEPEQ
jgi:exodeoxyribonuclease VII large subunit